MHVGVTHLPVNFLQVMENSMDPIHFEWLHAVYGNYVNKRQGKPAAMTPHILAVGDHSRPTLQIRVPVDDTHTLHYWYRAEQLPSGSPPQTVDKIPIFDVPYVHKNGRLVVETINGQDMMAWVTQGAISDRTTERLGTSDKGVILFRNLLLEQIDKVERGEHREAIAEAVRA